MDWQVLWRGRNPLRSPAPRVVRMSTMWLVSMCALLGAAFATPGLVRAADPAPTTRVGVLSDVRSVEAGAVHTSRSN